MDAFFWLESCQSQMTSELVDLASQNSGSSNLRGLLQVADWIEDWMDLKEASFQRIDLPAHKLIGESGKERIMETGPALRWDFQPHLPRRVLLAIHYDTVFPPHGSFQHCDWLSDDRLRGPGVADAKGGIVVLRYAMHALIKFRLSEGCGLTAILNPDEEIGSPSSAAMFQEIAADFNFGLLFEPCLPTGELVSERKGSGNFDIVVRGKSAHAGRHFEEGRNAVAMLCRILSKLDAINGTREGLTLNVGAVSGGGPVNIVPDFAIGRFNIRANDQPSSDWIIEQLTVIINQANLHPGFHVELHGRITSPPKTLSEGMRQLMRAVDTSHQYVCSAPVKWRTTGGVCDGNKLAAAGLPNIDTLGPLGDRLHSDAEWVRPSSLVEKAKLIVHLVSRFSDGDFSIDKT